MFRPIKAKTNSILKRKRKKNQLICINQQQLKLSLHPKAKLVKIVPVFQQRLADSSEQFLHRTSKGTHVFLKETTFEKKYSVQIEQDPETDQIQGLTKCRREKDNVKTLRTKHKKIKRKGRMT